MSPGDNVFHSHYYIKTNSVSLANGDICSTISVSKDITETQISMHVIINI